MQKFKDITSHEWEIHLLVGEVMRIKEAAPHFDLLEPQKDDLGKRLDNDLSLFWELLWHVVEPQAALVMPTADELKRRGNADAIPSVPGINAREFGRRMAGDCLISAQDLFLTEWRDFFHLIQRSDVAAALEAILIIRAQAFAKVKAQMDASPALQNLRDGIGPKIDQILTKSLSGLEGSLESILSITPTESSGSDTKATPDTPGLS